MSIKFTTYCNQAPIQNCYLCKQSSSQFICATCDSAFKRIKCKRNSVNLLTRPDVKKALGNSQFNALICPFEYRWPLDRLIKHLKFSRKDYVAEVLSNDLLHAIKKHYTTHEKPDAILPVPMHAKRFWYRRYNQATLLAQPLSSALNIPLRTELCKRVHFSKTQVNLSGKKRRENLRFAFEANAFCDINRIAIVDDVITTGATIDAIIDTLRRQHSHLAFDVWTLAISATNLE